MLPLGNAHVAAPNLLEVRFRRLLAETEGHYDVVLVHAGPVTASEDARILAIDGALLLTVPAGQVHPRGLERAVEHLQMVRIRTLGAAIVGGRGRTA